MRSLYVRSGRDTHYDMATKRCPVCNVAVNVENLERHVRNQHPRANVELGSLLSPDERREASKTKAVRRPALTRTGRWVILVSAVVVAVILVLVIVNPFRAIGPGVGQNAPDFAVTTSTGSPLTLSSMRGTPVLLEFMDPDCPHCQAQAPTLVSLNANYSASVRFVSIDVNFVGAPDDNTKINAFKSTYGTPWPYALDTTGGITSAYGVTSTPTTFILDRNGVVAAVFVGETAYADFAVQLNRLLGA